MAATRPYYVINALENIYMDTSLIPKHLLPLHSVSSTSSSVKTRSLNNLH